MQTRRIAALPQRRDCRWGVHNIDPQNLLPKGLWFVALAVTILLGEALVAIIVIVGQREMMWTWGWRGDCWFKSDSHGFIFEGVSTTNDVGLLIERYSATEDIEQIRISLQRSNHSLIYYKTCPIVAILVRPWRKIFLMFFLHFPSFIIILFFLQRRRDLLLHNFRSAFFWLPIWWLRGHWFLHRDVFIHDLLKWGPSVVVETDWE